MKRHDDQRQKWEYIGHRLMESSDLLVLCGVTIKSSGAEKPFVAYLHDHELKGMITFALERLREIDRRAESVAHLQAPDIPYEYRDRRQEYLRLQVPKSARHRSSELYNAEFINDLDEGFDTLQGVFVTLRRALSYLFEELSYRHGKPEPAFMKALLRNYPEYAGNIKGLMGEKPIVESAAGHRDIIKLNLTTEQLIPILIQYDYYIPINKKMRVYGMTGDRQGGSGNSKGSFSQSANSRTDARGSSGNLATGTWFIDGSGRRNPWYFKRLGL